MKKAIPDGMAFSKAALRVVCDGKAGIEIWIGPAVGTEMQLVACRTYTNAVVSLQSTSFPNPGADGPRSSPAIRPKDGHFLAFISNMTSGYCPACDPPTTQNAVTGSSIAQTFVLPAGASRVSFDVRLLNNDNAAFFHDFNSFGGVALSHGVVILGQYNLDLDSLSSANAHVIANAEAGGFQNSTPWLSKSFDVGWLAGQAVTLTAYVMHYGGTDTTETRLLLDNIRIDLSPIAARRSRQKSVESGG
jgi:hypothetical protein